MVDKDRGKSNKSLEDRLTGFQQDVLGFIMVPIFIYLGWMLIFKGAYWLNPVLGLAVAILIIILGIYLLINFSQDEVKLFGQPVPHVLSIFGIIIVALVAGFSSLSYSLSEFGWVRYVSDKPITPGGMGDHYLWNLINIIPGLEVWKTLKVDDPLQISGWWSGILLLCFKVIIIIPFIALVKKWWDHRKKNASAK